MIPRSQRSQLVNTTSNRTLTHLRRISPLNLPITLCSFHIPFPSKAIVNTPLHTINQHFIKLFFIQLHKTLASHTNRNLLKQQINQLLYFWSYLLVGQIRPKKLHPAVNIKTNSTRTYHSFCRIERRNAAYWKSVSPVSIRHAISIFLDSRKACYIC